MLEVEDAVLEEAVGGRNVLRHVLRLGLIPSKAEALQCFGDSGGAAEGDVGNQTPNPGQCLTSHLAYRNGRSGPEGVKAVPVDLCGKLWGRNDCTGRQVR